MSPEQVVAHHAPDAGSGLLGRRADLDFRHGRQPGDQYRTGDDLYPGPTVTTVPRLAAVGVIHLFSDALDAASPGGFHDQLVRRFSCVYTLKEQKARVSVCCEHILMHALPIGLRAGGMMTFAPFFGSDAIPRVSRHASPSC